MRAALFAAVTPLVALPLASAPASADRAEIPVAEVPSEELCTPPDPVLAELSGLTVLGETIYATPDAGADESVVALNSDCSVAQRFTPPVDPYDVEDLAAGPDGRLWLGDTGDNTQSRPTVALISLDPATGAGELYRLTYPDGPRDAETLLVSADGEPVIITKALFGPSGVYRPVRERGLTELDSPGPTPLEKVGALALGPTETPGGPLPGASSTLITGGAVSADGTVAAVRTYTDVYLFHAPDRDIAAALAEGPDLRIPVPDEPQGEAVAFTASGDLLTASETGTQTGTVAAVQPPIRILRSVVDLFADESVAATPEVSTSAVVPLAVAASAAVVAVGAGRWWWRSRRSRGHR
ncbi:hypothetical protein [Rhodococcus chondri]|uniref:Esterase-like activity of phytase family protein n=1 Tax=Rhodococcus chondri TaxID=3065941 RepID=A0ABU7JM18_9NOCA|nr:hypothetical protein [Rhodococcus sp. CC-R104]